MEVCKLESTCLPDDQRKPSSEHPYGTEWIFCKKAGIVKHCHSLNCIAKDSIKLEIDNEIISMYQNDFSIKEISGELNCSTGHVKNVLKKNNLFIPNNNSKSNILLNHKSLLLYLRFEKGMRYADLVGFIEQNYQLKISVDYLRETLKKWKGK